MAQVKTVANRDAYGEVLVELGKENPAIVVLDADLSSSTKTSLFAKAFPDRFFNCGVAEQDMLGVAAGLAASGKIVFASSFAMFATGRAWDQLRNSVAYPRLNVKVVATHGGITTGEDGVTHQAMEDIAITRVIPNLTVIVPADAFETRQAIKALVNMHGPAYVRLNRPALALVYPNEDYGFKIGRAVQLTEGKDVSILACGLMVKPSLDAADILRNEGISARVINVHTIKPLDTEQVLRAAAETGAMVTAEEHSILGGLGSAIAEVLVENCPVPVVRVGGRDMFAESGRPDELLEKYGMTAREIVSAAKLAVNRKLAKHA